MWIFDQTVLQIWICHSIGDFVVGYGNVCLNIVNVFSNIVGIYF